MNSLSNGSLELEQAAQRELGLSARQTADLFPFHIVFDRQMRVCQTGKSIPEVLPKLAPGTAIAEVLELEQTAIPFDFPSLLAAAGSQFVLKVREGNLRLRGQVVQLPGEDRLVFLGSPLGAEPSGPEELREREAALKEATRQLAAETENSKKLALIVGSMDNAVVVTDAMGRVEWINAAFPRITGYSFEEVRGRTPGSLLWGPETDRETAEFIEAQIRKGEGATREILNYRKDGSKYWALLELQPIHDEAGKVVNYMGIESDVTERRKAQFRSKLAYSVTAILAEATDTPQALQKLLQTIMEAIGFQFAVVWRLAETGKLHPVRIWSPPSLRNKSFEIATRKQSFERGIGLPGTVWALNRAHWVPDISQAKDFPRKIAAAADGLKSAFGFPIQVGGQFRGMMEFFSTGHEPLDENLLNMFTSLGNQIGQFVQRRDAESARLQLVALLNSTLESTGDGILVVDRDGRFVKWNERFLQIFGIPESLLMGTREVAISHVAKALIHPEDFSKRLNWWYEHPDKAGEDLILFRDGRVFRRATQPQLTEGIVTGRVWSYRDVTESWRAEEALRDSEERYRVISSTASDGIMTVNRFNTILFANAAAERMFGYPPTSLVGKPLIELMGGEFEKMSPKELFRVVHGALSSQGPTATVVTARRRDGEEIQVEVSFGKSQIGGEKVFTGVMRDITERIRAEDRLLQAMRATEAANRAKSDFLASMSHEIRTPLNSIAGLTELLRDSRLDDDQRDMVNTIWAGSESLLNLINDLLDFSKIEAGQIDLVSDEFDPLAVCERAVEIAKSRAQRKGLALICTVLPGQPPTVLGDANRLSQILLNLVVNGIKFTETGAVTVELRWKHGDTGRVLIEITVRDTGIGISPKERQLIFDKFYRADTEVGRRAGGTGLGLSIARLLAQRMNGSLSLEDRDGPGSSFLLKLDLPSVQDKPEQPPVWNATAVLLAREETSAILTHAWTTAGVTVLPFSDLTLAFNHLDLDGDCDFVILESAAAFDERILKSFFRLLSLRGKPRCIRIRSPYGAAASEPAIAGTLYVLDFPITPKRMRTALKKISGAGATPALESFDGAAASPLPVPLGPTGRILLVEDNTDSQIYESRVFHREGHHVTIAASVAETVHLFKSRPFDIVFMDVRLPDGSGFEAARMLREYERTAGKAPTPMIALTANAMQEYRERAIESGMNDYLTKPIRPEILLGAVRRWMPQKTESTPVELPETRVREAVPVFQPETTVVAADDGEEVRVDEDMADLIPGYLTRVTKNLEALLSPDATADNFRRIGHDLKGSGSAYGFHEITRLGKVIELSGRDANLVEARDAAQKLADYLQNVRWVAG
jgi:PAS domain S-box-containing protein